MEKVAQPHDVDRAAPVLAHHEIDIDAPLDRVWALHTHVDGWPEWQTDITEARIEGPFGPGTSFDWTSYGFSVTQTINRIDPTSSPGFGAVPVEEAAGRPVDGDQRVADDHLGALLNGLCPSMLVEVRRGEAGID